MTATAEGTVRLSDEQSGAIVRAVLEARMANPGG
jgi:hypothetical protein